MPEVATDIEELSVDDKNLLYGNGISAYRGQFSCGKSHGRGIFEKHVIGDQQSIAGFQRFQSELAAFEADTQNSDMEVSSPTRRATSAISRTTSASNGKAWKQCIRNFIADRKAAFLKYDGTFRDNAFHGKGTLVTECYEYSGNFKANEFSGEGRLKMLGGSSERYVGNFEKNRYDGEGLIKTSEFTYIGDFKKGKKEGFGTGRCLTSGLTFQGQWKDNLPGNGKADQFAVRQIDDTSLLSSRELPEDQQGIITASDADFYEVVAVEAGSFPLIWKVLPMSSENDDFSGEGGRQLRTLLIPEALTDEETAAGDVNWRDSNRSMLNQIGTIEAGVANLEWKTAPPPGRYLVKITDITPAVEAGYWEILRPLEFMISVRETT